MAEPGPPAPLPLDPREDSGEAIVRRTARNATFTATAQVIGKFSTLAWTLVAARQLGLEAFGLFALTLAVAQLTSVFAEWGFDSVLVHRGSQDRDRLPLFLTAALVWESAVALPLFAATWLWATRSHGGGTAFSVTLALVLLAQHLDICSDTLRGAAGALQRVGGASTALVVQRLATGGLAIWVLSAGGGPQALGAALLVGATIGLAAGAVAARRLGLRLTRVRWADLRDYERSARTVGVSAVVLMALFRADVILVAAFLGDRAVAAYTAAYRLFEATLFVVFSIRSAIFPVMSASKDPERTGRYYDQAFTAAAVLYAPFAVICLVDAPRLLRLLYGAEYVDLSSASLRWLALAPLTYAAAFLSSASLQAVGRARGMLPAALAAAIVNLALNVVLIPVLGIAVAAATTTGAYLVQALVSLGILRRAGCRPGPLAGLAVPAVGGLVLAVAVLALPLPLLPELAVAGGAYLALVILLGRRAGERFSLTRRLLRLG